MKVPPIQLPNGMDRLPLPLPFSPDLLWRYPNPFLDQPPPSPLESHVKSGLPGESPVSPQLHNLNIKTKEWEVASCDETSAIDVNILNCI